MKKKIIYLSTIFSLLLFSCQKDDETANNNTPDEEDELVKEISESEVADIANELATYWKLDEIKEEKYFQRIEDQDSVWHVYYSYRFSEGETFKPRPVPHFLIPKKEGGAIKVFVGH